jgi:hypothetical protein
MTDVAQKSDFIATFPESVDRSDKSKPDDSREAAGIAGDNRED